MFKLVVFVLQGNNAISVDIKTTDAHLVSSILNEIKEIFRG